MPKVAIVTGGGSGIGLAVSTALVAQGWQVAIIDYSGESKYAAKRINAMFMHADVSDSESLSRAFLLIWIKFQRLDFVFANAGTIERDPFYTISQKDELPSKVDLRSLRVNLEGVISTSHIALHFFCKNEKDVSPSLLITASSGGLYPLMSAPIYSAAKHGAVGFTRSIASSYLKHGIRVNCICPGSVRTNIASEAEWAAAQFPEDCMTSLDMIVGVVNKLILDETVNGQAVEVVGDKTYARSPPKYLDDRMRRLLEFYNGTSSPVPRARL